MRDGWLRVSPPPAPGAVDRLVREWRPVRGDADRRLRRRDLDRGEAEMLAVVAGTRGGVGVTVADDPVARAMHARVTRDVAAPGDRPVLTGTVGLLAHARSRGVIDRVEHELDRLRATGFRVHERVTAGIVGAEQAFDQGERVRRSADLRLAAAAPELLDQRALPAARRDHQLVARLVAADVAAVHRADPQLPAADREHEHRAFVVAAAAGFKLGRVPGQRVEWAARPGEAAADHAGRMQAAVGQVLVPMSRVELDRGAGQQRRDRGVSL